MRRLEDKAMEYGSVFVRYEMDVRKEYHHQSVDFGIEEFREVESHFTGEFSLEQNPRKMKDIIDSHVSNTNVSGKFWGVNIYGEESKTFIRIFFNYKNVL